MKEFIIILVMGILVLFIPYISDYTYSLYYGDIVMNLKPYQILSIYLIFRTGRAMVRHLSFFFAVRVNNPHIKMFLNSVYRNSYQEHTVLKADGSQRSREDMEDIMSKTRRQDQSEPELTKESKDNSKESPEISQESAFERTETPEGVLMFRSEAPEVSIAPDLDIDSENTIDLEDKEIVVCARHLVDSVSNRVRRREEIIPILKKALLLSGTAEGILMNNGLLRFNR